MPIEGPSEFVVECDGCGEETTTPATEFAGDPASWGVDDESLYEIGWSREGGEVYCPKCKEERE